MVLTSIAGIMCMLNTLTSLSNLSWFSYDLTLLNNFVNISTICDVSSYLQIIGIASMRQLSTTTFLSSSNFNMMLGTSLNGISCTFSNKLSINCAMIWHYLTFLASTTVTIRSWINPQISVPIASNKIGMLNKKSAKSGLYCWYSNLTLCKNYTIVGCTLKWSTSCTESSRLKSSRVILKRLEI